MNLLAPEHLWALLVLPVLWWLALPGRPRAVRWTAHFAQWQEALARQPRRPHRRRRLRFWLLALAAAAAVVAWCQPILPGLAGKQRLVVVLDGSASMAVPAVDGGASPFAQARAALATQLAAVPSHVEVTLVQPGRSLVRRHGASARALHDLAPPAGELGVDLAELTATVAADPATTVWTLTDGQGQRALPTAGALSLFANPGDNAALLSVQIDDAWPLPRMALRATVLAFAATAVEAEVGVVGACATVAPRSLRLQPGTAETVEFELLRTVAGGNLEVRVRLAGDRCASDDVWRLQLPPLPAPRIAVREEVDGGPFAQAAAKALAAEVGGSVVAVQPGEPIGFLLVDGGQLALVPGQVRALTFGTGLAVEPAAVASPWPQPTGIDWARAHPLLLGLDLSELAVQQATHGLLPAGEELLWADAPDGRVPLAVLVGAGTTASVHFAFRLQDGNLPLLAAFPQLLRRVFVASHGAAAVSSALSTAPAAAELDLTLVARGADRGLPAFASEDRDLAAWVLLAGLLCLAVRAFVR